MNSFSCNSSPLTHRYIVIALPKVSSTSVCFYSDVGWFVSVNMLFLFTKHPQLSFTYFSYTVTHHYVRNSCTRNIGSLALWITIYWYIYICVFRYFHFGHFVVDLDSCTVFWHGPYLSLSIYYTSPKHNYINIFWNLSLNYTPSQSIFSCFLIKAARKLVGLYKSKQPICSNRTPENVS